MFEGFAHAPGVESFDRSQTNVAVNAGVGLTHALTRWVGVRVDGRYLHAFVDESASTGGYARDYGFWRVSVGVVFGGPQSGQPSADDKIGQ
jgi:hypothetical protein